MEGYLHWQYNSCVAGWPVLKWRELLNGGVLNCKDHCSNNRKSIQAECICTWWSLSIHIYAGTGTPKLSWKIIAMTPLPLPPKGPVLISRGVTTNYINGWYHNRNKTVIITKSKKLTFYTRLNNDIDSWQGLYVVITHLITIKKKEKAKLNTLVKIWIIQGKSTWCRWENLMVRKNIAQKLDMFMLKHE